MARRGTWLVVALLAAIVLAAAVDAFRGANARETAPEAEPPPADTTVVPDAPVSEPEPESMLSGVLYYTDSSCVLRAVGMPGGEDAATPAWRDCPFSLSPDGAEVRPAGTVWAPDGAASAVEVGSRVELTPTGAGTVSFQGSAPAFAPDGRLTFASGGTLRVLHEDCPLPGGGAYLDAAAVEACSTVVLGADAFREALGGRTGPYAVRTAAWLDRRRVAAVVSSGDAEILALFRGNRLVQAIPGEGRFERLLPSPDGRLVAAVGDGLVILAQNGQALRGLELGPVEDVAWSPDGRLLAAATGTEVVVLPAQSGARVSERLPLAAGAIAWIAGSGDGPTAVADADEARNWLAGFPPGRLVLTDGDCRLRALRLPTLDWADEPAGVAGPCRFSLTPAGTAVPASVAVRASDGALAECRSGDIEVTEPGSAPVIRDACAPAWTPDGRLTFVRDGELWESNAGDDRLLVSRAELREMFDRDATLEEVAWFDEDRLWAVVRAGSSESVAAMTTARLVFAPSFVAQRIERLRVGPTGMLAALSDKGVVFFDTGGRRALTFAGARAVAWAPDSLLAAVATRGEILFVAPVSREVLAVPVEARDLAWVAADS